jgi:hypothetical protein
MTLAMTLWLALALKTLRGLETELGAAQINFASAAAGFR